ncbi:MAG: hypothetical protein KDC38_15845, partial [Planctomycetes bacterium]|nr:hypothetical protein [Planctomycetota bacterium]
PRSDGARQPRFVGPRTARSRATGHLPPSLAQPREAGTVPGFWPHIWAIPLTFVVGFIIGWGVRSSLGGTSASPHDDE